MLVVLRKEWLVEAIRNDLLALSNPRSKLGGKSSQPDRAWNISQPSGELSIEGQRKGPLQITAFSSFDQPVTATLSDKFNTIDCEFAPECHSAFEGRPLASFKGALIRLTSYEIRLRGSDGALLKKGITFLNQPTPKDSITKGPDNRSGVGSIPEKKRATGAAYTNVPPPPEPLFLIRKFEYIAEGPSVQNPPKVTTHQQLRELLLGVPQKRMPKQMPRPQQGSGGSNKELRRPHSTPRLEEGCNPKTAGKLHESRYQSTALARRTADKNPSRLGADGSSGDETIEFLSQPEWGAGSGSERGDGDDNDSSQQLATQAANRYSSTFEEFTFTTQSHKEIVGPSTPLQKLLPSSRRSAHNPPNFSEARGTDSRSRPSKPSAQTKNGDARKSRYINYTDDISFPRSAHSPVAIHDGSMNKAGARRQGKRNPEQLDILTHLDPRSETIRVPVEASKRGLTYHPGWEGMTEVPRHISTVPKDQQKVLEQQNSWYPQMSGPVSYTPNYDYFTKAQLTTKERQPRVLQFQAPGCTIRETITTPSQECLVVESSASEFSWPSSPEPEGRRPKRTETPPHSSMISSGAKRKSPRTPATNGGPRLAPLKIQIDGDDGPASSWNLRSQNPVSVGDAGSQNSTPSSKWSSGREGSTKEEMPFKRITRSASGISKRVAPDPTNSELNRPKNHPQGRSPSNEVEDEPESSGESDESGGSCAREFSVEPPVPVQDPNGYTLVAKYGILGSQQVDMWNKDRKKRQMSGGSSTVVIESENDIDDEPLSSCLGSNQSGGSGVCSNAEIIEASSESIAPEDPSIQSGNSSPESRGSFEEGNHQLLYQELHQGIATDNQSKGHCSPAHSTTLESNRATSLFDPKSGSLPSALAYSNPALDSYCSNKHKAREIHSEDDFEAMDISDNNGDMPQPPQPKTPSKMGFSLPKEAQARSDKQLLNRSPRQPVSHNLEQKGHRDIVATETPSPAPIPATAAFLQPPPSPNPATIIQVKGTPYRKSKVATPQTRKPYPDDNFDLETIPGTIEMPNSSQEQLRREQQEHLKSQAPASPEGARPPLARNIDSMMGPRAMRQPKLSSQEIRTADASDIPKLLEKQKRQFLGLTDETPLKHGHAREISPVSDNLQGEYEARTSSDSRKRHKSSHASEPRGRGGAPSATVKSPGLVNRKARPPTRVSTGSPPPNSLLARVKPIPIIDLSRSSDEEDSAAISNDPMPGNSLWFADETAKPEMYAGIRERTVYVPGYKNMTEKQKADLERGRKEYFGVGQARPWNNPWKPIAESATLERARPANSDDLKKEARGHWYRDADTPMKQFFSKFRALKTVKADAAGIAAREDGEMHEQ